MRVALVHDEIVCKGGAERVLLSLHRLFPEAPIYTMCYLPNHTYQEFRKCNIKTSIFQKIAFSEKQMKFLFFPFGLISMMLLKIRNYDLVIFSTTYCAKYVRLSNNKKIVYYCHNPFRLAWYPESYYEKNKLIKNIYINLVSKILKPIDFYFANRADIYIANSNVVRQRINEKYKIDFQSISVINPPVFFRQVKEIQLETISKFNEINYFLIVSRLEKYKKVDLVINAFKEIKNYHLVIVGEGTLRNYIEAIKSSNIHFLGQVSEDELVKLYKNAQALIFPQIEDFGITPLEANYWGIPVIAFNQGGVLETMIDFYADEENATALFFDKQNEESIIKAVNKFSKLKFNKNAFKRNIVRFSEESFHNNIIRLIDNNL